MVAGCEPFAAGLEEGVERVLPQILFRQIELALDRPELAGIAILRHKVDTDPSLVTLRIDESLYFANARFLEDYVYARIARDKPIRHVVLMCSAVNEIDMSALESLEAINRRLHDLDIALHLSEVKGPVMDRLKRSHFLDELTGRVFLAQYDAWRQLTAQNAVDSPEAAQ